LAIVATDDDQGDEDVIEAYQAGDAGWIVTHGRFTFEDGSWVANRIVNVVVRDPEDGGWKSVLTTSQLLVPNELLTDGSPAAGSRATETGRSSAPAREPLTRERWSQRSETPGRTERCSARRKSRERQSSSALGPIPFGRERVGRRELS
jgi:hypothetical protein